MSGSNKPRISVRAGAGGEIDMTNLTTDNFQNFRANLGMGTNNLMSGVLMGSTLSPASARYWSGCIVAHGWCRKWLIARPMI